MEEDTKLRGKDYPYLCEGCQATIDEIWAALEEGPDSDDDEAAAMYMYDHSLYCGGRTCANKKGE